MDNKTEDYLDSLLSNISPEHKRQVQEKKVLIIWLTLKKSWSIWIWRSLSRISRERLTERKGRKRGLLSRNFLTI